MLCISRKVEEQVVLAVGDVEIVVKVCNVRGDRVSLGFEAPRVVGIHRDQVPEHKRREYGRTSFVPAATATVAPSYPSIEQLRVEAPFLEHEV